MPQKSFALSGKVLICDAQGRCLLLKRSMASKNNKGKWDLPGGNMAQAAALLGRNRYAQYRLMGRLGMEAGRARKGR